MWNGQNDLAGLVGPNNLPDSDEAIVSCHTMVSDFTQVRQKLLCPELLKQEKRRSSKVGFASSAMPGRVCCSALTADKAIFVLLARSFDAQFQSQLSLLMCC